MLNFEERGRHGGAELPVWTRCTGQLEDNYRTTTGQLTGQPTGQLNLPHEACICVKRKEILIFKYWISLECAFYLIKGVVLWVVL